ncbi:FAD-dependent pyridine nucleotide-disulfide oxidoreductase [Lepidopterella palustris CBS 459.81]|uniref:FAD-dependent pyridine nucleotide-disulfide oxidoreductase n=1 Tax=Lepidopterella palustris CBS 459.81 TaxID=1314670 RepID=A0A8E2DZP2_9PEZI|nr:FAD-dependent pyridine nucleotide-disulfide oxidoreductase [Lepidopterella palustris CBS 459.81]
MPSRVQQKIVIVGGVAGGMSAATRARRLDETSFISVFEKGPYVSYANCGIPYALGKVIKDDDALILQTPAAFKDRFNIDVHVNTEVVGIDRENHTIDVRSVGTDETYQVPYDKLILSQGAEPFRPPIEGVDLPHVFTLQTIPDLKEVELFLSKHEVKHVAVIGGGFIGLEAVENLRHLGLEVSIIECAPHVVPPIDIDIAEPLHTELRHNQVLLHLNAKAQRIEIGRVVLADGYEVPADLVLLVAGVRARTSLAREAGLKIGKTGVTVNSGMQTSDPDIYAVGDMVETEHRVAGHPLVLALAGPANRQGRLAADHIYKRAVSYRGNVGVGICKVFDLTVAITGLSIRELRQMGQDPLWVTVHPPDHAGYYPGAHPITLKVAFERYTGRLLGAQAIGTTGVDKRIDVLSTAMQAGMTIFDLEHLELAYAPPYGSAKDPVNMAGFVGSNVLRGDTEIIHAEELNTEELEEAQLVDVRSPGEFSRGHVPFAVNVPVNHLRDSVTTLDKGRRIIVYCQVGYRGYLAYRILKQNGFDVVNLDGGYKAIVQGGFTALQTPSETK